MKKQSLIKLAGLALAATLVFAGCGSNGDGAVLGGGGNGVGATGGGGTTAATTGFGITGGSQTGGFGGTGGGSAGSAFTGSGSSSAGNTGTTGGNGGFLGPVAPTDVRTGLNNPTAFTSITIGGNLRTVILDGFNLGINQGRLLVIDQTGNIDPQNGGFPLIPVTAANTSPLGAELTSPFDMIQDLDGRLYISVGFDVANEGKIIRVDGFQQSGNTITANFTDITAARTPPPLNPAFMTFVGNINGNDYIYYSQYSTGPAGLVSRVAVDGSENTDIVNNITFPAGIDHDGTRLAICDQITGGLGQVLLAPLVANPPAVVDAGSLTVVAPAQGEQAITRPFDVDYDGNNGFFFTEGASIDPPGFVGPTPTGQGNGTVRFISDGTSIAQLVSNGLTNCGVVDAADPDNDGTASVLFSESAQANSGGRISRRQVATNNVTLTPPSVVDTGVNNALFVAIGDEDAPVLGAAINYFGAQANGIFRVYAP